MRTEQPTLCTGPAPVLMLNPQGTLRSCFRRWELQECIRAALSDLDGPEQALFAERHHIELSTKAKGCSPRVHWLHLSPLFATMALGTTTAAILAVSLANTDITPAKKTKHMKQRRYCAHNKVAENVTVNDWVNRWGKYGFYNNNGFVFCKRT